ncbi:terpene synthase 14 [Rhynchospora pubera]|uniref:Terpene synthase 14 n=1 Tax=Rhynchospora pubera TaxID=906938 RepID=A0AAV8F7Q1_9POAL|nr:terpene synthase 14 [Rhynchospora pubera]
MGNPLLISRDNFGSSFFKSSPFWAQRNFAPAAVSLPRNSVPVDHHTLHFHDRCTTTPFKYEFHEDPCYLSKIGQNMEKVRTMLSQPSHKSNAIVTVDALKKLGIDHFFGEEISAILDLSYNNMYKTLKESDVKLTDIALQFKLLREAGYDVSSDVFQRFMNENGEFKQYLSKDVEGLISLHDASFLNMGEEMLYTAKNFSTMHLQSSVKHLGQRCGALVRHTLEHPHHMSLKQYKARHYLTQVLLYLTSDDGSLSIKELAETEFHLNQLLYQDEFKKIKRWWSDLGLARELTFARDQILKWYLWSMTALPGPQFSKHRLELTKSVSFIYIIDDIFDIMGNPEELTLFTQTINSWEDSSALPGYMRACFIALKDVTSGIAQFVEEEYGLNPINNLKRSWAILCNAFMVEARWFADKQVPNAEEYLRNGIISSGVHLVMVHLLFLLGHRVTNETLHIIEGNSALVSCTAKILRLWDDLGSAMDENQEGFDGSYVEYYMKDNPSCSLEAAKLHTKKLISKSWEELNKEYFFNKSLSPYFKEASLNCARMVNVMYNYDEQQQLPLMNDYIQNLLFGGK